MNRITPMELAEGIGRGDHYALLDVRESWERRYARLEDSLHIPLGMLAWRWKEIDPSRRWVVYCHHGFRSARACAFLQANGIEEVYNLEGGIDLWSRTVDGALPLY